MLCYFLSVTAPPLIRTDTIFRQSGIFKLMVPLNFFSWLSLLFMAQEFAVTYPDSAKVLHVCGFKFMLKPVWSENTMYGVRKPSMGFVLSQEPHGSSWFPDIKAGRQLCKLSSAAETEQEAQVWLWAQGTDSWLRDTWAQPQANVTLKQLRTAVELKRCQEPTGAKEPENLGHN